MLEDEGAAGLRSATHRHSWRAIGPDRANDPLGLRPYFLVPILGTEYDRELDQTTDRIEKWLAGGANRKVSDVFIFAHGWHENFYKATLVYDTLASSIARLLYSGRLNPPEEFDPVYLSLHWHSDPGRDGWRDHKGARDFASFTSNVLSAFGRPEDGQLQQEFGRDFDQFFEVCARVTAAESKPDSSSRTADGRTLAELAQSMVRYGLLEAPEAGPAEKMARAWQCYHDAEVQPFLVSQNAPRRSFLNPVQSLASLAGFAAACAGPALFLGLAGFAAYKLRRELRAARTRLKRERVHVPPAARALILAAPVIASWLVLESAARGRRNQVNNPDKPAPQYVVAAWVVLQVALSLPLILYSFSSFLVGSMTPIHPSLFDERFGRRDREGKRGRKRFPRHWLALVAAHPTDLLRRASYRHSRTDLLAKQVDSQLSFWTMQQRAVQAGEQSAEWLLSLLERAPELRSARIHLFGHSFGPLVAANLVRHLTLNQGLSDRLKQAFSGDFRSMCFMGAAISDRWLEHEPRVRARVHTIGCTYSRSDTACSFYYPFTNHGRVAAGYVGLAGDFQPQEWRAPTALVQTPDLGVNERAAPAVVNIDASRVLYEGPPAQGGSHDDIFRDAALYLFWALTGLEQKKAARSQEGGGAELRSD